MFTVHVVLARHFSLLDNWCHRRYLVHTSGFSYSASLKYKLACGAVVVSFESKCVILIVGKSTGRGRWRVTADWVIGSAWLRLGGRGGGVQGLL